MQPLAYIIFSNLPGQNRLKNLKFFLRLGDNVVGADPRCQIALHPQYEMLHHAVNIRLGLNFLTVEAFQPHLVYVQGNLNKNHRQSNSDNFFPLAANVKYLPKIGEFFYIGRIKAVIGSACQEDLLQMKNIVNHELFLSEPPKIQQNDLHQIDPVALHDSPQKESGRVDNVVEGPTLEENQFDPYKSQQMEIELKVNNLSMKVEQKHEQRPQVDNLDPEMRSERSVTEQLDQHDAVEATLVLEDGMFGNEPTINLDICPFQYQQTENKAEEVVFKPVIQYSQKKSNDSNPQSKQFSQQILMAQIRRNSSQPQQHLEDEEIDFSMPDTIIDKQAEEHPLISPLKKPERAENMFKQVESKEQEVQNDEDEMPPTIQEVHQMVHVQKIKPTKTLQNHGKRSIFPERLYRSDQISFESHQQEVQDKNIQNFDDLFGIQQKPQEISHYKSLPTVESVEPSLGLMHVSSVNQDKTVEQEEKKKDAGRRKRGRSKNKEEEETLENKVNIVGFKPTAAHRDFLKKQGYELVSNPHHDYGILLVKQPIKIHNKLLHALLDGKIIQTQQWIFNKESEVQSKINGLTWKQIYQKRGTHGLLLKGKGRFYVSKRLEDLFEGVVQKLGGDLVEELSDKRRVLNVILRAQDSLDTEMYLQNREVKKWRFLRSEIIIDSILTAHFSLQQKYIIDIFKDDC